MLPEQQRPRYLTPPSMGLRLLGIALLMSSVYLVSCQALFTF